MQEGDPLGERPGGGCQSSAGSRLEGVPEGDPRAETPLRGPGVPGRGAASLGVRATPSVDPA